MNEDEEETIRNLNNWLQKKTIIKCDYHWVGETLIIFLHDNTIVEISTDCGLKANIIEN